MESLIQDTRYGFRSLLQSRTFAAAALVCLALGIGINTALFTVVHAILLRPLPIEDAERVVSVFWTNYERGIDDGGVSFADMDEFRATGLFTALEGVSTRGVTITAGDLPERVEAGYVTPGLLPMIGAVPARGRSFHEADAAPAGFAQVVLLSHALWQRQFGGEAEVLGRRLRVNDRELEIVGVMPPGFRFPERADLWLPIAAGNAAERQARAYWALGRLRPGVSRVTAAARIRELGERIRAQEASNIDRVAATLLDYRSSVVDAPARRALWLMSGAVALVLLVACANVANLLLARASERRRELALRAALGASRARIVRQLLTESVLLAFAGAALGLIVAVWWVDLITGRIPEELPYWIRFDVDATVLVFTAAVAISTALLFGTLPALQASRADLQSELRQSGRASESSERVRLRGALVVGEIALSLVLLVAAALVVQSFMRVMRADVGFDDSRMLTMRAQLIGDQYDSPLARAEFWQRAAERLRSVPGIAGAAVTSAIPADDGGPTALVQLPGERSGLLVMEFASTTGYFDALGLQLLAGRDFRPGEVRDTAARVAIIGQALARRLYPEGDALGRTIRLLEPALELEVIGIAPDLQYDEFGEDVAGTRYQLHLPYARFGWRGMNLMVRGHGDPGALTQVVRSELRRLEPLLAPYEEMTFAERRHFTQWNVEMLGSAFGSFGVSALLLALAGIYGVMAGTVARRRHELGVRCALGATPRAVAGLVLRRGIRLTLLGTGLGAVGAVAVTRLLQDLLFEVRADDPRTLCGMSLLLGGAALFASWIPARRAAGANPLEALRSE